MLSNKYISERERERILKDDDDMMGGKKRSIKI